MATPTRTLHPLPFEHLEHRRFEDLIRQIAYEFRNWRALESTGRSGADAGYDIRGWEIVPGPELPEPSNEEDEEEAATDSSPENDLLWLFQCKREQSIGPKKLGQYLDDIGQDTLGSLYGLVFAASCDFSKKSRDVFRSKCRDAGISECHIWSRGELEDMLFQPKNDGLLFAYFGISLRIRRRSLKTAVRTKLTTKRKAVRAFGGGNYLHKEVLLRDPEDEKYPYLHEELHRDDHRWLVRAVIAHHPLGIEIEYKKFMAFLAEDGVQWDMAEAFNTAANFQIDPWLDLEQSRSLQLSVEKYWFDKIDEKCRGYLIVTGLLLFEDIIEIDPDGDSLFSTPHVYVSFSGNKPPFYGTTARIEVPAVTEPADDGRYNQIAEPRETWIRDKVENRTKVFPKKFRKVT